MILLGASNAYVPSLGFLIMSLGGSHMTVDDEKFFFSDGMFDTGISALPQKLNL